MPTTIHVSDFTIDECTFQGSTCKLRRFYDSDWTDQDGVFHPQGSVKNPADFSSDIDCTITNHVISVPAFDETPTVTALINTNVRRTWQFVDQAGVGRNIIADGWFIPASPSTTTRGALDVLNQGQSLLWPPPTYLNSAGVQALIDIALGIAHYATSLIAGWVRLSVAPASSADPVAVGDNDSRIAKATGIGVLVAGVSTTIASTLTAANSPIEVISADEGIVGHLYPLNRVDGVSFDVASENGADAGNFKYFLF